MKGNQFQFCTFLQLIDKENVSLRIKIVTETQFKLVNYVVAKYLQYITTYLPLDLKKVQILNYENFIFIINEVETCILDKRIDI